MNFVESSITNCFVTVTACDEIEEYKACTVLQNMAIDLQYSNQ